MKKVKLGSYLHYTNQNYKVTSEGHFDDERLWTNKEWNESNHEDVPKESNIWSIVISFNQEYQENNNIFSKEIASELVANSFNTFCRDNKMNPKAFAYVGQFHVDKPHHFHIHLRVHEKYPSSFNGKTGKDEFRRRGKFNPASFEKWKANIDYVLENKKHHPWKEFQIARDAVTYEVKNTLAKNTNYFNESLKLAKEIKLECGSGRFSYNSLRTPIKLKVDKLVDMLIVKDKVVGVSWTLVDKSIKKMENKLLNRLQKSGLDSEDAVKSIKDLSKASRKKAWVSVANAILKEIKNNKYIINVFNNPKSKTSTGEDAFVRKQYDKRNNFFRKTKTLNFITIINQIHKSMEKEWVEIKKQTMEFELEQKQKEDEDMENEY